MKIMKLYLFTIISFSYFLGYSQFDPSKFYLLNSSDTDVLCPVKSIEVMHLLKKNDSGRIVLKQYFYKNGKPKERFVYREHLKEPFITIKFDSLGRITMGSSIYRIGYHTEKFYYSDNNIIPDSINDFWKDSLLVGQYINYLKNDKIICIPVKYHNFVMPAMTILSKTFSPKYLRLIL